jgi:hypothetical protein
MALLRRVSGRLFNSAGARAFPAGGMLVSVIVAIVAIAGDRASAGLSISTPRSRSSEAWRVGLA